MPPLHHIKPATNPAMNQGTTRSETAKQKATFRLHYDTICKQNNTNPLQSVTAALRQNKLDILGDRVKLEDWAQIVKALRYDKSLHMIAIRSRYPCSTVIDVIDEKRAACVKKQPVLFTRYVMGGLVSAINECLASTDACNYLELEGLPLRREFLDAVMDGVGKCASLQKLSLYRSQIGDQGVAVVCQALKDMPNVKELDLTGCGVTRLGAGMVAEMLTYQSLQRWGEGWKQSLRYRVPDVETFPGIRRITLNHNAMLGDRGLKPIMDTLKDDIFLRALDLQGCGLSNDSAILIINTLRVNKELLVIDVRANQLISRSLLARIMQALVRNQGLAMCNSYPWLELAKSPNPRKTATSKSSLYLRPDTVPNGVPRIGVPVKKRAITADNRAPIKCTRPVTCKPGTRGHRLSPRSPPRPRAGKATRARGGEVAVVGEEGPDKYEEVFTSKVVFFEKDRLREDCQLLSMELRDEVDKLEEAETSLERVRNAAMSLRAQLEEERSKRLEAEAVLHNLLGVVKKANDVNAGLKMQRDAAIIAAMEPGRHTSFAEFLPTDVNVDGRRDARRRASPHKLKKWSCAVAKRPEPTDLLHADKQAGDCVDPAHARPKLSKSQQVFLELDRQARGQWGGEETF